MIYGFDLTPTIETHVVRMIFQMMPFGGEISTTFPALRKSNGLFTKHRSPEDIALPLSPFRLNFWRCLSSSGFGSKVSIWEGCLPSSEKYNASLWPCDEHQLNECSLPVQGRKMPRPKTSPQTIESLLRERLATMFCCFIKFIWSYDLI